MNRLTRYCMYKKIGKVFKEPMRGGILGVSGVNNFYPLIDKDGSKLTEVDYPEPFRVRGCLPGLSQSGFPHVQHPSTIEWTRKTAHPRSLAYLSAAVSRGFSVIVSPLSPPARPSSAEVRRWGKRPPCRNARVEFRSTDRL